MRTHTTQKRYKYDICGKNHNQPSSLTMHMGTRIILDAECHEIYVKKSPSSSLRCYVRRLNQMAPPPSLGCQVRTLSEMAASHSLRCQVWTLSQIISSLSHKFQMRRLNVICLKCKQMTVLLNHRYQARRSNVAYNRKC